MRVWFPCCDGVKLTEQEPVEREQDVAESDPPEVVQLTIPVGDAPFTVAEHDAGAPTAGVAGAQAREVVDELGGSRTLTSFAPRSLT